MDLLQEESVSIPLFFITPDLLDLLFFLAGGCCLTMSCYWSMCFMLCGTPWYVIGWAITVAKLSTHCIVCMTVCECGGWGWVGG